MRTFIELLVVPCFLAGCANATPLATADDATPAAAASALMVNARASADAWIDVRVVDRASGLPAFSQTLAVTGGRADTWALPLPDGDYTVGASVYRDAALATLRGEADLPLTLARDAPVLLKLDLADDQAPMTLIGDRAPSIAGVDVTIDPSGRAILSARASDPDGDRLSVYWGSAAAADVLTPGTALTIDPARAALYSPTAYLTVQDGPARARRRACCSPSSPAPARCAAPPP